MRIKYFPDCDTLFIELTPGPARGGAIDASDLVLAGINADDSINYITIDHAAEQLDRDLVNDPPDPKWAADPGPATNWTQLTFGYFPDTDTLAIQFNPPPCTGWVEDVTDNVIAGINADGNISYVTIEHASKQLRRDLVNDPPELVWAMDEGDPAEVAVAAEPEAVPA